MERPKRVRWSANAILPAITVLILSIVLDDFNNIVIIYIGYVVFGCLMDVLTFGLRKRYWVSQTKIEHYEKLLKKHHARTNNTSK